MPAPPRDVITGCRSGWGFLPNTTAQYVSGTASCRPGTARESGPTRNGVVADGRIAAKCRPPVSSRPGAAPFFNHEEGEPFSRPLIKPQRIARTFGGPDDSRLPVYAGLTLKPSQVEFSARTLFCKHDARRHGIKRAIPSPDSRLRSR